MSTKETNEEVKKDKDKELKIYHSLAPKNVKPEVYLQLVKDQIMGRDKKGNSRSTEETMLFLYTCQRTGLDPILKQIHPVFRWSSSHGKEVMSIQTGIDGMRLVAQRTGKYAGAEDIKYNPEDESLDYPHTATATIYKFIGGHRVAFTGTARWKEFAVTDKAGKPEFMWARMPYHMLGKCAEALALRKAFPNELSGVYAKEEMEQAEEVLNKLPTPERFNKEEKIEVEHGRPADMKVEEVKPKNTSVADMRNNLKDKRNGKQDKPTKPSAGKV
jgi:phage recombination protein Bet